MTIYHGSQSEISSPVFGLGKPYNDYGLGFYCTENTELAKEWACAVGKDGFANKYELNMEGLSVLYLNDKQYHILNWISILLENRTFNISEGISMRAKQYILEHFLPDYKTYDVIIGYRADDSYFSYASDFIENTLSLENLRTAMKLGKLGEQVVLISPKAFDALTFVGSVPASAKEYFEKYKDRDRKARSEYRELKKESNPEEGVYVMDIIRQKWENNDARLY
ncbi:MAG: DUF3990 domain-containing protein [Paludibacteraceae bacterium]|nr:DUF3990 domain-containing protein [Paludibacteraceae bacterium]